MVAGRAAAWLSSAAGRPVSLVFALLALSFSTLADPGLVLLQTQARVSDGTISRTAVTASQMRIVSRDTPTSKPDQEEQRLRDELMEALGDVLGTSLPASAHDDGTPAVALEASGTQPLVPASVVDGAGTQRISTLARHETHDAASNASTMPCQGALDATEEAVQAQGELAVAVVARQAAEAKFIDARGKFLAEEQRLRDAKWEETVLSDNVKSMVAAEAKSREASERLVADRRLQAAEMRDTLAKVADEKVKAANDVARVQGEAAVNASAITAQAAKDLVSAQEKATEQTIDVQKATLNASMTMSTPPPTPAPASVLPPPALPVPVVPATEIVPETKAPTPRRRASPVSSTTLAAVTSPPALAPAPAPALVPMVPAMVPMPAGLAPPMTVPLPGVPAPMAGLAPIPGIGAGPVPLMYPPVR